MNETNEARELHDEVAFDRSMHEQGMTNTMEAQKAINDGLKGKAACWWMLSLLILTTTLVVPVLAFRLT